MQTETGQIIPSDNLHGYFQILRPRYSAWDSKPWWHWLVWFPCSLFSVPSTFFGFTLQTLPFIEGKYEEIIEDLDSVTLEHDVIINSHGYYPVPGNEDIHNYGLFSVNLDIEEHRYGECILCDYNDPPIDETYLYNVKYDPTIRLWKNWLQAPFGEFVAFSFCLKRMETGVSLNLASAAVSKFDA